MSLDFWISFLIGAVVGAILWQIVLHFWSYKLIDLVKTFGKWLEKISE